MQELKAGFCRDSKYIQLNNSGQALVPAAYRDTAKLWLDRFYDEGAAVWPVAWPIADQVRVKLAKTMGAAAEETAFFTSTSSAVSQAAISVPLQKGDEVLTWDQEYPSNFYPWRLACEKAGAKLIQVPSVNWQTPADEILKRVTSKTKAIAISWVQYQTGAVTDLKAISSALKGRDVWLMADVIQGAGVRPFDFHDSGFDFACAGSHKYLCSGYGTGFLLVKKSRIEQMPLLESGAFTFGDPDTPKSFTILPKKDATKFEPGAKPLVEILAFGATLDLFSSVGTPAIYQEACRLADRLRAGLRQLDCQIFSPDGYVVTFAPGGGRSVDQVVSLFTEAKVLHAKRGPGIRLSTHAYNREEEIDHVLQLLR